MGRHGPYTTPRTHHTIDRAPTKSHPLHKLQLTGLINRESLGIALTLYTRVSRRVARIDKGWGVESERLRG